MNKIKAEITESGSFPVAAKAFLTTLSPRRRYWLYCWLHWQISHAQNKPEAASRFAPADAAQEADLRTFCERHSLNYDGLKCFLATLYEPRRAHTPATQKAESRWFQKERLISLDAPLFYAVQLCAYLKTGIWQTALTEDKNTTLVINAVQEGDFDFASLFHARFSTHIEIDKILQVKKELNFTTLFEKPSN